MTGRPLRKPSLPVHQLRPKHLPAVSPPAPVARFPPVISGSQMWRGRGEGICPSSGSYSALQVGGDAWPSSLILSSDCFCLSIIYLSIYLSVCLSIIFLSRSSNHLSSIYLSIYLSISYHLFVYHLSIIYLSIHPSSTYVALSLTPDFELTQASCYIFGRVTLFATQWNTLGEW